jgi:hypothetical protein
MIDAPQQDWSLYKAMSRQSDAAWIRSLSPADRFELYADLFDLIWEARRTLPFGDRVDDRHWRQKVEVRQRLTNAFACREP